MQKNKTVNPGRAEIFTKKHANENKIIDLPILLPCESTLLLQVKRVNYVAKLWKTCLDLDLTLPSLQNHGWLDSGAMQWVEEVFLEDYCDCLNMHTEEIAYYSDTETDSESDNDNISV